MMNVTIISDDTYYYMGCEKLAGYRAVNLFPCCISGLSDLRLSLERRKATGRDNEIFIFVVNDFTLLEYAVARARQQRLRAIFLVDHPLEYKHFLCGRLLFASKKHNRHEFYALLSLLSNVQEYPGDSFSAREREVLEMLLSGIEPHDIARYLAISDKTISAHKKKVARRFGMDGWNDALMYRYLTLLAGHADEPAARAPVAVGYWRAENARRASMP